ncbi:hypothetical protein J4N02_11900 [Propioniciclava sp. MC1595]|uniref:hypothetical protein n=1 Tax=Propioniciclava sp. MC1595 TaxID=2760308 RepID=UPI0016625D8F|nr:hypothetical protein [Propioniciclava sp. MC1595]MBB1494255.1 hypothetical protein [Propioniciclava sp. MC1595]QTE25233.1 hypothetical protein J4N02_11900 [Propioniciclava sp. MC1595]
MVDLDAVASVLAERGPLTGADLHAAVGGEVFGLWKACRNDDDFRLRRIGRRYLRLDRTVEGFARLSPSILREFLTYTVVGLPGQDEAIEAAATALEKRTVRISRLKRRTAERFTTEVMSIAGVPRDSEHVCVLIAGDVVYGMSHDVARQESSTGGRVDGSDLDLVVLASDDAPESLVEALDEAIRQRKWLYLRNPMVREEVDYIVKRFSRLEEQVGFDTFPHQVACKVFDEAEFLAGNRALHEAGRRLLAERGVLDRLREMEQRAAERRVGLEEYLRGIEGDSLPPETKQQFYTDDEDAEFEHRT